MWGLDSENRKELQNMKRRLKNALISALIITLVSGIGAFAYVALIGRIDVAVPEPLSFVGESEFQVELYPGESQSISITVANASSADLDVDLDYFVFPDPAGHLIVSIPNKITAPGGGEVSVDVTVTILKSATPGAYEISYEIIR